MKEKNRGLSLIELIVTIAIVGIITLAIGGFMVTGSNSYNATSKEVNLQYEAQLTVNQLQDLIIDATRGVTYQVEIAGQPTQTVLKDTSIAEDTIVAKNLYIYNDSIAYEITWKKSDQKLYYSKFSSVVSGAAIVLSPQTTQVLMSENVSSFSANIEDLEKDSTVRLSLDFANGDKTYETFHNVTLRNNVLINSSEDAIYNGSYIDTDTSTINSISIVPSGATLWPGGTFSFYHVVSSNSGGYPSQDVIWTVEGAMSASTSIANGLLTVGSDESSSSIVVKVTSKKATGVTKTANVLIKQVGTITITPDLASSTYNGIELYAGNTIKLAATVAGQNIEANATDQAVTWSILQGSAYATIDTNGLVTVSSTAPMDTIITIQAVSARKNNVLQTISYTVTNEDITFTMGVKNGGAAQVVRNSSIAFQAAVSGVSNLSAYTVVWSYELRNASNVPVTNPYTGGITMDTTNAALEKTMNVGTSLDFNQNFEIVVTATVKKNGVNLVQNGSVVKQEVTVTIPKVLVKYRLRNEDTYQEGISIILSKNISTNVYFDITGIASPSISWSLVSNSRMSTSNSTSSPLTITGKNTTGTVTISPRINNTQTSSDITIYVKTSNITVGSVGYYAPTPSESGFTTSGTYYLNENLKYEYGIYTGYWYIDVYKKINGNWSRQNSWYYYNSKWNYWY